MTRASEAKLEILADPDALARRMANWLLAAATTKDGVFAIALSGGSTPRRLYERLTEPPYRDEFPWSRSHWFWADERFVPHDDELSNYRMVREALLSRALLRPRSCPVRNPLIPLSEKPKPALFITNNTALPALSACALYKARWQVELFFRWIKMHLRIKSFFGTSENAVKSQIWIAVSVYVFVAIVKKRLNLSRSLYEMLQILSLNLFEKTPLDTALSTIALAQESTDDGKQLILFN
jgi:hypothetical protein